ncbi:MAG: imidazole glycerol phosphate synthase subunit HisF [bacterium]|nr:imidazole glycerol phosphate synthase subunit HisF [bacterium]
MVAKRIIACLDVDCGRTMKGVKFQNLVDVGDPVELAMQYQEDGADELVLLDITATIAGRAFFTDVVAEVSDALSIPFTVGGGVRTIADAERLLNAGADRVSINTAAVLNPQIISEAAFQFGSQCIVVAVDTHCIRPGELRVVINAGNTVTEWSPEQWCQQVADLGTGEILLTSMDHDGLGVGYDIATIARIKELITIPIIASGGAGDTAHIVAAFECGADAALVAGILHRGDTTIAHIKADCMKRGVVIRSV